MMSQFLLLLFFFSPFSVHQNNNGKNKQDCNMSMSSMFVDANLLQTLPKLTPSSPRPSTSVATKPIFNNNKFIYEFTYSLSDLNTDESSSDESIKSSLYENYSNDIETKLTVFLGFVADYAKWKKWDSVRLAFPFPLVNIDICNQFQRTLILIDIHVVCESYDHGQSLLIGNETFTLDLPNTSSSYTPNNMSLMTIGTNMIPSRTTMVHWALRATYQNIPTITLNFLVPRIGNRINLKLITQFSSSSDVLMLGENFIVQDELHPNMKYFNYKLTVGSYMVNENWNESIGNGTSESEMKIHVEEIYGFATSPKEVRSDLGSWSSKSGLEIVHKHTHGLADFQGQLLRVTSVEGNPLVYLDRNRTTKQVKRARGYLPDILESISEHLNFSYVLIEPVDRSFGSNGSNGNWTGMVGQIQRQEVDIALMSFSFTAARKQIMDFSPPIEYSAARLLIRRDIQNTELKWDVFLAPFEWKIWLAIPCTVAIGVLLLYVFAYFKIMEVTPLASACLLLICFLQKSVDGHTTFKKLPCRIALGSIWLLAVVIYASYTAVLTSFLASTTERLPINSLGEAVHNTNWKVGLIKGSSYQDRVKQSPQPEFKQFSKRIEQDQTGLISTFRDGLDKVFNEKYGFFTSDLVPSFMVKGNCSYTWVPGKYFAGFGYMGYPKNLPFAPPISHRIAKIRETGQMKRLFKKWWGEGSGCSNVGEAFVGMSLYETGTAFLVLAFGISLALLFWSIELLSRPKNIVDTNLENPFEKNTSNELPQLNESTGFQPGISTISNESEKFTIYNNGIGNIIRGNRLKLPFQKSSWNSQILK